jgi:GntR family transcriptional regulator
VEDITPLLPLHHRVYALLHKQISDEVFSYGMRLPGEIQLCEKFNVSRITVRRALLRLEEEGLVSRQPGKGTFVIRPSMKWGHNGDAAPLTEHVAKENSAYESRLLEFTFIPTPNHFNSGPDGYGPVVLKISRVALVDGSPVHVHVSYVPERLGRRINYAAVEKTPVANLLRENGVEVAEVELTIDAAAANEEHAAWLAVPVGAPLVNGMQLSRAANGSPVEFTMTLSRPDLFRYRFRSNERQRIIAPIPGLRRVGERPGRSWSSSEDAEAWP